MPRDTLASIYSSRQPCAGGCGRRTAGRLFCAECARKDPWESKQRLRAERVNAIRRLIASGASTVGTCAECLHWSGSDCHLEIPEVSVSFARECSFFDLE
jgi:hypothetical protein